MLAHMYVCVCVCVCVCIPLSVTNKMQRYTIFFIAVNAVHVSGGFSAHHQELKLYTQHLVYVKLSCCYCWHG